MTSVCTCREQSIYLQWSRTKKGLPIRAWTISVDRACSSRTKLIWKQINFCKGNGIVARFPVWDKIKRAEQVNKMSSIDRGLKQYSRNSTCCRIAVCLLLFVWQIKQILAVLDKELENEALQTFTWRQYWITIILVQEAQPQSVFFPNPDGPWSLITLA